LLYLLWYIPFAYPDLPLWLGASLYLPTLALLVRTIITAEGAEGRRG
jgi:hypothetical protein